jgi:hypothetical protein
MMNKFRKTLDRSAGAARQLCGTHGGQCGGSGGGRRERGFLGAFGQDAAQHTAMRVVDLFPSALRAEIRRRGDSIGRHLCGVRLESNNRYFAKTRLAYRGATDNFCALLKYLWQ